MALLAFLVISSRAFQHATISSMSCKSTRLFSSSSNSVLPEGLVKTVSKPGNGDPVKLGDIATVKYTCYVPDSKPFAKSTRQKMVVGDGTMIPGWDQALKSMVVGERAIVRVSPELAYGEQGIPTLVPPNSPIEMDLELLDVQPPTLNIDFDSIATADNTPVCNSNIEIMTMMP